MKVACKECRAEFRSTASESANLLLDLHDCPATPKPNKGEPFDEYQKRADAFAAEWRANQRGASA